MKVIFLDIDGVLNSKRFFLGSKIDSKIDPNCVSQLNTLIEETGAKIVISSSWRITHSKKEIREALAEHGFKGSIIGYTETLDVWGNGPAPRGVEIKSFLQKNNRIKNYVILDDESDMLFDQRNNFVQTSGDEGLTQNDVSKCIEILSK